MKTPPARLDISMSHFVSIIMILARNGRKSCRYSSISLDPAQRDEKFMRFAVIPRQGLQFFDMYASPAQGMDSIVRLFDVKRSNLFNREARVR